MGNRVLVRRKIKRKIDHVVTVNLKPNKNYFYCNKNSLNLQLNRAVLHINNPTLLSATLEAE
jgi:hypothetical protein